MTPAAPVAKPTRVLLIVPLFLSGFVVLWSVTVGPLGPRPAVAPPIIDGRLDLRAWDFAHQGSVALRGPWRFVNRTGVTTFRQVPDRWRGMDGGAADGMGYGVYELEVLLPQDDEHPALRVSTAATAMEVRVAGQIVAAAGRPSPDREHARSAYQPQVIGIPRSLIDSGGSAPSVTIQVAVSNWNYRTGGLWEAPVLGELQQTIAEKRAVDDTAFALAVFLMSIAGIGFTVFLARRSEVTFLLFAVFCLTAALRVLCTDQYLILTRFPKTTFDTVIRLEYFSFMVTVQFGLWFFLVFFDQLCGRRLKIALLVPYSVFAVVLPFLPLVVLTRSIALLNAITYSGMAVTAGMLLRRLVKQPRVEAAVVVSGALILALATANDSLFASRILVTGNIAPPVLAGFIALMAAILSRRLLINFDRAEVLGAALQQANTRLAGELHNSQVARAALEEALRDRETLIREIHHRVKNSLQIVGSIISLQARRITDPAVRRLFESMNARIRAIALVHEKLYDVDSLATIDVGSYLQDLARLLTAAYAPADAAIALHVPTQRLHADLEFCIDLGLMMNELVSNACKHGAKTDACTAGVDYTDGCVAISVQNRLAAPLPATDAASERGLGFKVLRTVLKRSNGSFSLTAADGVATARIVVPLPAEPPNPAAE